MAPPGMYSGSTPLGKTAQDATVVTQDGSSFHDPEWRLFSNRDATLEMVKGTQYSHISWVVGGREGKSRMAYLLGRVGEGRGQASALPAT